VPPPTLARLALLALAAAVAAGVAGCGKKGPPLAPLVYQAGPIGDLTVTQFGDNLVLSATVPTSYRQGGRFDLASLEVRLLVDESAPLYSAARATEAAGDERNAALLLEAARRADPKARPAKRPPLPLPERRASAEVDPSPPEPVGISPAGRAPDDAVATAAPVASEAAAAAAAQTAVQQERTRRLRARFAGEARPVLSLDGKDELAAAALAGRIVLTVPAPAVRGALLAAAVVASGTRKGDQPVQSNVATLEVGPVQPAPVAPEVRSVEPGIEVAVDTGPDAPIALFAGPHEGGPFLPFPVGGSAVERSPYVDRAQEIGKPICYVAARPVGGAGGRVYSNLSPAACVTRQDRFAPDVPQDLRAYASAGGVLLVWRPSSAADLAGYHVWRGAGPERKRLTADPVTEATYLDRTAEAGRSHTYQVTAIDRAMPPNESEPSAAVTEVVP
jgi:hypothetical protein